MGVLLGNADGTFTPAVPPTVTVGTNPVGVALLNLNPAVDCFLDLVVANNVSDNVGVLFGNGNGTFDPQTTTGMTNAFGLITADFNNDTIADVAVAQRGNPRNNVTILLGAANGLGTFQAPQSFFTGNAPGVGGALTAVALAAADFNGDTILDLAVVNQNNAFSNYNGDISIVFGNGNGGFGPKTTLIAGNNPVDIAIGDLDGDGDFDLAVANILTNNVSVFLDSGGVFGAAVSYAIGGQGISVAIADLDGDGKADILAGTGGPASRCCAETATVPSRPSTPSPPEARSRTS